MMRRLWWTLVRFFFRLLYNEFAWTYDLVAWVVSLGQWNAWGRTTLRRLRGERVLELAHGPGHLLVAMAGQGLSPTGLDLSPHMGRLAKARLERKGVHVPLVRARAQALPFRSGCFDSAVATFPTEFILNPATLRETARVTAGDGRLVIAAWCRLSGNDLFSRLLKWLYRVTGQAGPLPAGSEAAAEGAGFAMRTAWECVGRSEVMLVVAEKR